MGFQDNAGNYHAFRKSIPLSLNNFRIVTSAGAVGAIAAIGGVPASDSAGPTMVAEATSETMSLAWAAGNAAIVQQQVAIPEDFSGKDDLLLELWVLTDNTGGGGIDPASFNSLVSFNNGAQVADSVTDSVPAITRHKLTIRIAHADIPDDAEYLNVQLFPGTHASDPVRLQSACFKYVAKVTA